MSSVDPSKFKFSTLFRYLLNYNYDDASVYSVSVPAKSYAAGEATLHILSIPLDDKADFNRVLLNYSLEPNNWYLYPGYTMAIDVAGTPTFEAYAVGVSTGSGLLLKIITVNQAASAKNMPGFTVTARPLLFIEPT